ncbi:MAG: TlpA family protein disulfide reductase [Bacteroidales bacterium]|nr:TlpA family protein disulfide reductase [Bacteroidales bacterium]
MNSFVRFVSVALLVAIASVAGAQTNVTIHGEVVNGAGKEVTLYRYSDMLTRTEVTVDHAVIGANRTFELKAYANYPTMMMLQIENYSQSFFVEPGRDYEVYVPRFDWDVDEKKNVFLSPEVLPLEFVNMPADELNGMISNFEAVVADYIDAHRVYFDARFRPQKRYFDSLEAVVAKKAPDTRNEFFNRYKRYQLASMKYSLHFDTRRHMVGRYIKGQPIMYYDDNYMAFFMTLFANSVSKGTNKIPAWQLGHWVNTLNVKVYLDSLGTDTLLRNEQVRELVALQALQEAYYLNRYYESGKVVKMIEMVGAQSKFPEHKELAKRLAASLRQNEEGSEVPTFVLPDVDKRMVSFDSMKGKWVYLAFVRVGDPNCVAEIETMAHFKDSVYAKNKNVEFVCVSCDREFQKMYHFLKNTKKGQKYNWTWLHFNGNYKLLENYGVVSYPHFILINPEGQLQYTVTPSPASGILLHGPWQPKPQYNDDDQPFFLRY